jgi:hypothetical protein
MTPPPSSVANGKEKGGRFLHHFLPSITGHEPKDSIDMNTQLQQYFEFVATVWHSFAPSELKDKFPRSFKFPVTVPYSYLGELPPELKDIRMLEIEISEAKTGANNGIRKEKN